jgi:bla regulator protein BlaR1
MTRIPVFLAVALSLNSVRAARAHEASASRNHPASDDVDDEDCDCDHADDDDDDATEAWHRVATSSFAWAVVREDGNSMSGSLEDLKKALRLRKTIAPPYLWVRDGDERYVISDGKVLDKLDELEEPQRVLAAKQAKLGRKQAELGRKQARLGMEQARAAMQRVHEAASGDDGSDRDGTETTVREIADQQRELGSAQGQLGRQQGALGREHGRLGRRLEEQVRELYQEAKKSGAARRVD